MGGRYELGGEAPEQHKGLRDGADAPIFDVPDGFL
jgi:hypothetical protein